CADLDRPQPYRVGRLVGPGRVEQERAAAFVDEAGCAVHISDVDGVRVQPGRGDAGRRPVPGHDHGGYAADRRGALRGVLDVGELAEVVEAGARRDGRGRLG